MDLFRKAYSDQSFSPSDSIDYTYPKKPLLTFLKEKGVKLNKEQEAIRLRQEKLAGTTAKNYNEAVNCREREDGIAL